ncbi:hypothetical protein [Streptomyces sp. WAC00303]|uniref:hypothetical protein n=1 Tax=Streptomyces sp. WAC00303 TaxID=2933779 RepID=UPI00205570C6|nr:hypothetical protein [Streptomyces sp. WAC00303]UPT43561.1 hypothetical protein MWG59_20435 [Streptomyces sp. WAC00303]
MSGPEQRDEHRHENDPTGNGIVNHGPEKTPHTDPDRPHEGSAVPEPGETPEPAPPARVDSEVAEDLDGQGPGRGTAEAAADTGTDAAAEPAEPAAEPAEPAAEPAEPAEPAAETAAGKDADTASASNTGSSTASGKDPGSGAPDDDDLVGTLTDLFARDRGAPASDELDEVALRRMLHGAVRELAPSEGTLDHLHRAVPARRARRRQAVVGAAAAALLIGTAVPAFVHVATSDGPSAARPAIAGHGEQAQGGNGDESGPEAPGRRTVEPTERESEGSAGEADPDPSPTEGEGSDPDGTATGVATDSPSADFASLPVCDPSQLGVASAGTGAPGADGTVYGSFRIANVSGTDCTVSSNGTVGFTAIGAADPLKIGVVQHTAGDAAPGLPDPSQEPGTVLLKPAMAYEVRFAWVPTDTCPTVGPSPSPTPSADGAGGSVGEGGTDQPSGVDTQSLREDGGTTAEGSVAVTHTPETGAPTAETKIPNACSGTIYRTGVLATS